MFQDDALWPRLTVAENVGYALKVQRCRGPSGASGWPRPSARSGSTAWRTKRPDDLSGLQRQRVALARALAVRPELLILDEPIGRLETRVRDEFRDEIRRIHAETELTTLVLTDDPARRWRWPTAWR